MTHLWDFKNWTAKDQVDGSSLALHDGATCSNWIYNNKYIYYLALNNGYAALASGVYFNSEFSIVAKVHLGTSFDKWSRIIEFGVGKSVDNIILMFNDGDASHYYPSFYVLYSNTKQISVKSSINLSDVSSDFGWICIVATFESTQAKIYINKVLAGTTTYDSFLPRNVTRTKNYIGGSSWGGSETDSLVGEIRTYTGVLTTKEISNIC